MWQTDANITVILLPLRPVSLLNKNPKRPKIIPGMGLVGRKDRSIYLNMCIICRNICGSYYGCCLMIHFSFSLCCALK